MSLEQVLADARGEAQVLRKHGQEAVATAIEGLCGDVAAAAEPYLRWLSEVEASLRSRRKVPWLRQRFARWESEGFARFNPRAKHERQYLQCVIPLAHGHAGSVVQDAVDEARRAG